MYPFAYHRPGSKEQAANLAHDKEDAKFLAGGMTLLPTMKQRLASPSALIDLGGLDDLRGIAVDASSVTIGAMTRHVAVANSAEVAKAIPALAALAGMIGDPAVRNRGTIGGSIANNDPAADYPAAALALGATIYTDKRELSADDYFTDCSKPRSKTEKWSPRFRSPFLKKPGTRSFAIPPRVMRSSASSSPRALRACASP